MKNDPARPQSGRDSSHPLWMRLLTVFCMALLGVASTVQACHSHNEPFESGLARVTASSHQAATPAAPDSDSTPGSSVRCPLCVAMHSTLPVTHTLIQVAVLRLDPPPSLTASAPRLFLWRSELASRPPPSASPLA